MFSTNTRKNTIKTKSPLDSRVANTARDLKVRDLPQDLKENAMKAFRQQAPQTSRSSSRVPRRLVIGAVTVAAIGVVATVGGPRFATPPVSAASIVDAIQSTNTWHLSGWRLQNGKKVRWEVWGRRAPFFYREQIGDEIVTDDGNTRLHLLPPQRLHPKGMLFILPSQPLQTKQTREQKHNSAYDTTAFLGGTSGDYNHSFTLKAPITTPLVLEGSVISSGFVDEQVRLTADPQTRLPLGYELIRTRFKNPNHEIDDGDKGETWTKAALRAEYNVPFPLEVLQGAKSITTAASDYQIIDLTTTPNLPTGAQYGMARKGGITVVGETLSRDEEGNLRLKYQVWLGNVKTGREESHLYPSLMLRCPPSTQPWEAEYPKDDKGIAYLYLNAPDGDTGGRRQDYELGYLATSEPSKAWTPFKPGTLTIPVHVRVAVFEDDVENGMNLRSMVEEDLTITVPLPTQVSSLQYDRPRPQMPGLSWKYAAQQQTLRLAAAWQRGNYWSNQGKDRQRFPAKIMNRSYLERAKQEYALALTEAERTQNKEMVKNMWSSIESVEKELK